ncbi:MAG TPA: MobF family relaxase [Noviherbaspirillum sp.]|nr:MobF family relaxase [Noviherbaspirillum sp.]
MLSFKFVTNAGGAAHYFENTDDYYAKEGHRGIWQGKGAELLGLSGGVDREVFKSLLEGKLPNGEVARKRMPKLQKEGKKSKERLGIDFTFSAPKSVSIVALVNGDERLIRAHDEAVSAALAVLEGKALARKKEKGLSFRQHTGNLTFATFRHELSRTQDPQLHTHAVAMNLTQRDDGKWVALTNDEMLKAVKVIGAYYRANLAKRLQELGYEIRATRHGFELADVSEEAIKLFSKRSQQIEKALEEKGLDRDRAGSKTKQTITQATRPNKTDADRSALRQEWIDVLHEAGIEIKPSGIFENIKERVQEAMTEIGRSVMPDALRERLDARKAAKEAESEGDQARRAVDFAIEHLMERQGIFTKAELLERAYMRGLGALGAIETEVARAIGDGRIIPELPLYQSAKSFSRDAQARTQDFQHEYFKHEDALKLTASSWVAITMARTGMAQADAEKLVQDSIAASRLVRTEERFTTRTMLADEKTVLAMEVAGRRTVTPIKAAADVDAMFASSTLNDGQKAAARLILTTENRFTGVQGYAGVGKSHMLKETVDAIKEEAVRQAREQGYEVFGLAPYASQNKALAELGMKSQTLASFLLRKQDHGRLTDKSIVFLDEASVVPVHQMRDLFEKIEKAGARLVLIGDIKQTQAVEAGKPFEQLLENGMAVAHITEIQRQRNQELKAAVVSAATGKLREAARQLGSRTLQIRDPAQRYLAIATKYVSLDEAQRHKTLIVAGTNKARREINAKVRELLVLEGGVAVRTLQSVDMTRAEKKQAGSFEPGQVIIYEGGKKGSSVLVKGLHYTVLETDDLRNRLTVAAPDGQVVVIEPAKQRNLSVYTREDIELTKGDWVRMTRNNTALGIANGERYQVEKVTADSICFTNGVKLSRSEPQHMQYGYAMTVNSAQGLTADRVLIDVDTKSLTANRAVFYVSISRPRDELVIFTDDKTKLPASVSREPKKYAALELRNESLEKEMLAKTLSRQALAKAMKSAKQAGTPVAPGLSSNESTNKLKKGSPKLVKK